MYDPIGGSSLEYSMIWETEARIVGWPLEGSQVNICIILPLAKLILYICMFYLYFMAKFFSTTSLYRHTYTYVFIYKLVLYEKTTYRYIYIFTHMYI